jgi:diaminopimelate epimerase
MRFSTWRAAGNTYAVVEPGHAALDAGHAQELAVGTDGVLEVLAVRGETVEIAIWNPDGSRAELSGNGTRIASAWLSERSGAREIRVRVGARVVESVIDVAGVIRQELGAFDVRPPETVDEITFTPVSVGNPHAVVAGDPAEIVRIGPLLERHPHFPERTNVQVARLDAAGVAIARVWERGVGETASSGTSAVAVAAALCGSGDVLVRFPGGDLRVALQDGRATLFGTAERVD